MTARIEEFGHTRAGQPVSRVWLEAGGLRAAVLTRGAVLQDLRLQGVAHPLTLGAPEIAAYEGPMRYLGAVVGPVANRIGGAQAVIAGRSYRFEANEGTTTLHGGDAGLHAHHWSIDRAETDLLCLSCTLRDGEGGFPGNRRISAEYRLKAPATLTLRLRAASDAPTLMNLANHSLWNLDGTATHDGHRLRIKADRYLETDVHKLPIAPPRPVAGTRFDLRRARSLDAPQGYDHNFCLADAPTALRAVAELTGARGIRMVLETTEPGLQLFDATGFDSAPHAGHGGAPLGNRAGIALEAQRWPDAPNNPGFPSILLEGGALYEQITRFRISRV